LGKEDILMVKSYITDEQVIEIASIQLARFTRNNRRELDALIREQVIKHNLTGIARQAFEVKLLLFAIKKAASLN
jgi:hypothetical protein